MIARLLLTALLGKSAVPNANASIESLARILLAGPDNFALPGVTALRDAALEAGNTEQGAMWDQVLEAIERLEARKA